ncbi:unnamed protein product [Leptidea sinapis]|uniref:acid phosphatase n=1 Tax=Leptidea sinapis TaxID=189913 RepID=A0A5E4PZ88_9NEOP|nr:unnamed protein product [Leptidea sinapis]
MTLHMPMFALITIVYVASLKSGAIFGKNIESEISNKKQVLEGKPQLTLKYAAIIYRHGDRTPVDPYPTDPWKDQSLWPVKFGELTNIGKNQHYTLGRFLRLRYQNFISKDFNPDEVYVRSTNVDRTLMSAQANLAGFYPPSDKSIWNKDLLWQPIPVHTKPEEDDEVLAMKKVCLAYTKARTVYVNSNTFQHQLQKYQHLMKYMTAHTGKKIQNFDDMQSINSVLTIEQLYNFTLPNWTHSVFPDKLREPSCHSFSTSAATPVMARLLVGPIMKQIFEHMQDAINKTSNHLKLSMFSGHDFTIGSILTALGLFDGNCPEYTATIFLELFSNCSSSENLIRVSYRNSADIVEPEVLYIPGCGTLCEIHKFRKLYDNLIAVEWESECNIKKNLMHFIAICGLIICSGTAYYSWRNRRETIK